MSLTSMLVAMTVAALLVTGVLQFHHQLEPQLHDEHARWQAHQRLRLAAWLMESELRRAGDWGLLPLCRVDALPPAVMGGRGEVSCSNFRCQMPDAGGRALTRQPSDAVIIHRGHEASGEHAALADACRAGHTYPFVQATAFYLSGPSGQAKGLYQRSTDQRDAQELVRGISGLACDYAMVAAGSSATELRWLKAADIRDWQHVVAVRCQLVASGTPAITREFTVVLDNQRDRLAAASDFRALLNELQEEGGAGH